MSWELWLLGGFALLGLFWWDGLQKREIAVGTARRACERAGVQLLDDSVALLRLRLARDADQRLRIARQYGFEFTDTGNNRLAGRVYLLGAHLLDVNLILPPSPDSPPAPTPAPQARVIPLVRPPV